MTIRELRDRLNFWIQDAGEDMEVWIEIGDAANYDPKTKLEKVEPRNSVQIIRGKRIHGEPVELILSGRKV